MLACACGRRVEPQHGPGPWCHPPDSKTLAASLLLQGTNGGVTRAGLLASVAGGAFIGLVFWSVAAVSPTLYTVPALQEPAIEQWSLVLLGEMREQRLLAVSLSPQQGFSLSVPAPDGA